jgi:hypothetical protein
MRCGGVDKIYELAVVKHHHRINQVFEKKSETFSE